MEQNDDRIYQSNRDGSSPTRLAPALRRIRGEHAARGHGAQSLQANVAHVRHRASLFFPGAYSGIRFIVEGCRESVCAGRLSYDVAAHESLRALRSFIGAVRAEQAGGESRGTAG